MFSSKGLQNNMPIICCCCPDIFYNVYTIEILLLTKTVTCIVSPSRLLTM